MPYYSGPPRGGLFSAIGAIVSPLAKAGVIRGSVGKALGYKPPPKPSGTISIPSIFGGGHINPPGFGPPGMGYQSGRAAAATGCPPGYHPDKKTGTKCVRNRRLNPTNPRAARRAITRLAGFERIARRIVTFRTGRSPGKGKIKGRARR